MAPRQTVEDKLPIYGETHQQREAKTEALRLFHLLWGKDKDTKDYDKQKWMDLQTALARLGVTI